MTEAILDSNQHRVISSPGGIFPLCDCGLTALDADDERRRLARAAAINEAG
jgi:hypothetical protein